MGRRKRRPKTKRPPSYIQTRTQPGGGIWPSTLFKMRKAERLAEGLLEARSVEQFIHPEYTVTRRYGGPIVVRFNYDETGPEDVLVQERRAGKTWTSYVDTDCLDELIDTLERELVLETLADV